MLLEFLYSKIHRATVTDANLNYVGSITIDETLLKAANIKEWQKKLGIGIKFVKEPEGSDYPEITRLSEVIDMFNQ